jgi:hypothetical protein
MSRAGHFRLYTLTYPLARHRKRYRGRDSIHVFRVFHLFPTRICMWKRQKKKKWEKGIQLVRWTQMRNVTCLTATQLGSICMPVYLRNIQFLSLYTTVSGLIRIFPALPSHCTKIWNDRPSTFRSSQSLYYSYQPFHPNPFWKSTINQLGGVVFFLYQHSSSTLRGAPAILIQSGFFFIFLFREVLAGGRKAEDLFSPFYYCTL